MRKLIEFPQGGDQCADYLYFRLDGTQVGPYHCSSYRDPESWNNNVLEFRTQSFIEIIYQVRRAIGAGGKFWMQIRGNLHSNISESQSQRIHFDLIEMGIIQVCS